MSINNNLQQLYARHWKAYSKAVAEAMRGMTEMQKPCFPLLLSLTQWTDGVQDESWYTTADIKVMVFGQETNKWHGEYSANCDDFGNPPSKVFLPDISVGSVMGIYEDFYASCYHGKSSFGYGRRHGYFHHGVNLLLKELDKKYADKSVALVWNNIVKTGLAYKSGFVGGAIYDIERRHFDVIKEEVKLLRPDVIVFLTGSYDQRIRDVFGDVVFSPLGCYGTNELAKVALPGIDTPAYRAPHPSNRQMKSAEMEARYRAIVNDINL